MVIFKAAVLMVFGISVGNAMQNLGTPLPLDMASKAVDDMYKGCEEPMKTIVNTQYLQNELDKTQNFKQAWDEAEKYYKSLNVKPSLTKEQVMAIHAYTLNEPPLYFYFNNAVRQERNKYKTTFAYHTLYFYLTTAIQTLKSKKKSCFTSYRRTNMRFRQDVLNTQIRFGAFTSSSVDSDSYPGKHFGEMSCFEIYTCFGAEISKYSKFPSEKEVLIPPYEVFKVTKIERKEKKKSSCWKFCKKSLPCEVVYTLQSTREPTSNLNCALSKNQNQQSIGF